jgi:hypothetical protein
MAIVSRSLIFVGFFSLLILGCGGPKASSPPPASIAEERALCSASLAITDPVTLTGTASFQARLVTTSGLGNPSSIIGIAYAEVEVLDGSGTVIQCGATDVSGNLVATDLTSALRINKVAGQYTVRVNSRASNSKIKVSILNNYTTNTVYSVTGAFSLAGSESTKAVTVTTASATGTLEGGAFNILYQIYLANEFLRNNSSCPAAPASEVSVCSAFTVAPKIKVFWAPGVDPGTSYLGLGYPISAYLRTNDTNTKGLYILGGKNGDSDCTDTDHFDNSIVLHEYGHFLEEYFAQSDSPGGSHNGNGIIDPRLAWSEGWANFFQAAVLGNPVYQDSIRNSSCTSLGTALQINLKMDDQVTDTYSCSSGTQPTMTLSQDIPTFANEGVFREVDVSRTLYQLMTNSATSGVQANLGFSYIWRAFHSSANGIAKTTDHFRNSGLLNSYIYSLIVANSIATTNFTNVMTLEKQAYDTTTYFYAQPITSKSCALTPFSLTGGTSTEVKKDGVTTTRDCNNAAHTTPSLQKNNHFFRYDWAGGPLTLNLKYTSAGSPDLNLYIYNENHSLYSVSTMVGYSAVLRASETISGGYHVETVTIPSLAAGTYLIQVEMDDSSNYNGITADYMLTLSSGATLCP